MGSDNINHIKVTAVYGNGTTKQFKISQERFNWNLRIEQDKNGIYEVAETPYDHNRTEIKSISELAGATFRIIANTYDVREIDNHLVKCILQFICNSENPRRLLDEIRRSDIQISQDLFEVDDIGQEMSDNDLADILMAKCNSILGLELIDIFASAMDADTALASLKIENDAIMYIDEELYDLVDVRLDKLDLDEYGIVDEDDPDFDEHVEELEDYISCAGIVGYIYDAARNYLLSGDEGTLKDEIRESLSQEEFWDVSCSYYVQGCNALDMKE